MKLLAQRLKSQSTLARTHQSARLVDQWARLADQWTRVLSDVVQNDFCSDEAGAEWVTTQRSYQTGASDAYSVPHD